MDNMSDEYLFKNLEGDEEIINDEAYTEETVYEDTYEDKQSYTDVYEDEPEYSDSISEDAVSYEEKYVDSDKPKVNLGIISFLLFVGSFLFTGIGRVASASSFDLPIYGALETIQGMMLFASFVIMIIARVKDPSNGFAKAVMWLFIALFIFIVIIVVALIAFCASCAKAGF